MPPLLNVVVSLLVPFIAEMSQIASSVVSPQLLTSQLPLLSPIQASQYASTTLDVVTQLVWPLSAILHPSRMPLMPSPLTVDAQLCSAS